MGMVCNVMGHDISRLNFDFQLGVARGDTDGLGVEHVRIKTLCDRCGAVVWLGKIMIPPEGLHPRDNLQTRTPYSSIIDDRVYHLSREVAALRKAAGAYQ